MIQGQAQKSLFFTECNTSITEEIEATKDA
jgi:hypothetical protein